MTEATGRVAVRCVGPADAARRAADRLGAAGDIAATTADPDEAHESDAVVLVGGDVIGVLRELRAGSPDLPVILAPRNGDESLAAAAVEADASAYVPWDGDFPADEVRDRIVAATGTGAAPTDEGVGALLPVSTLVVDQSGDCVWLNDRAAKRLSDGSPPSASPLDGFDIYDEDGEYLPPPERPYRRVLESGEAIHGWEGQIDRDGERRWVSIHARPVRDGGEVTHAVVSVTDVTDRREREETLRAEREQFRRLVDAVEDYAIFRLDVDGRVATWNEGAEQIKGYDQSDIVGEHFSTFYTDADAAAGVPEENLRAAREEGRTEDEGWRVRADGSRFWASVVITALRDDDGELVGYSKVTRDETERYEYERELERERTELAAELDGVLERVSDAFFALDDEWQFTYVNTEAARLIEVDPDAAIGESIWAEFPAAVGTPFESQYRHAMSEQESVSFEEYFPPLERWFEVTAYPSETGLSVYFQDVTERRERRREYETLVENFPNGAVALFDDSLTYRLVGGSLPERVDGPPERLEGESVTDALPDAVAETVVPRYRETLAGDGTSFVVEKGDEARRFYTHPVRDETGSVIAGLAMSQDVTERRDRHAELLRRATEQASVADLGRQALRTGDLDGLIEEAVTTVTEALGVERGAVLEATADGERLTLRAGAGWPVAATGEAAAQGETPTATALQNGDPVVIGDRDERWEPLAEEGILGGAVVPIDGRDGPWGALGVVTDDPDVVSETDVAFLRSVAALLAAAVARRTRDRELERYEVLTETTTDGVFMTDGGGRLLLVNDAFAELVGRDRATLTGAPVAEVIGEDLVARARAIDRSDGSESNRLAFEIGGDGTATPVEATVSDLPDGEGVVGVLRDVTARERFERRLRSLHESSRNLFEATTDTAVSKHVVEALTNDLDLSGVVVYRRSGDDLVPVAQSEGTDFVPDRLPTLPLADSVAGRVFRAGESESLAAVHDDPDCYVPETESEMGGAVVAPIGHDGVVVAGSRDRGAFDEETRQLVDIVAENAAAAYRRVDKERELRSQRQRLAALDDLNSLAQSIAEAVVQQSDRDEIERLVCERLAGSDSYEFAWVGEADTESGTVALRQEAGVRGYLDDLTLHLDGDGPTAKALRQREMQVVQNVAESEDYGPWREHAREKGYRSSAAIPILFQDTLYGVLNVYSGRRGGFGDAERETLGRLGTIVGHAIRSVEREQRLRESEKRYRTLAEQIPNGVVMLVGSDEQVRTAAGAALDDLDIGPEDLEGAHIGDIPYSSEPTRERMVGAVQSALDGEPSRIEVEYAGGIYEVQTIPIREDDAVIGAMTLAVEVTERKRREEELEAERARLEFLNRLIRHNLLNGLNVVDARLELLSGEVPEAYAEHLDTARTRTSEMIDLVETIRSLMSSVVGDDEDLDPVDVDAVLTEEVEIAARSYPDAEFDLRAAGGATVLADELLEEVFENLLGNAVKHNDTETPRVRVETAVGDEEVRVRVVDNGPGVPPALQEEIFGKGTQSFDSPGTGFGLHLSREIVDAYGGDISVDDAKDGGAVFTVTLPRA